MATLIKKMMSLVRPGVDSKAEFYAGKTVTEVEWWIAYACHYPELYWGRLRVFSDGTADAASDEANVYGFDDRKFAGYFLGEDEYTPFATLSPEDEQLIGAKASQMSPPTWNDTATHFEYLGTY
jgi:hypothetical protein